MNFLYFILYLVFYFHLPPYTERNYIIGSFVFCLQNIIISPSVSNRLCLCLYHCLFPSHDPRFPPSRFFPLSSFCFLTRLPSSFFVVCFLFPFWHMSHSSTYFNVSKYCDVRRHIREKIFFIIILLYSGREYNNFRGFGSGKLIPITRDYCSLIIFLKQNRT